jgi:hypothetical protein
MIGATCCKEPLRTAHDPAWSAKYLAMESYVYEEKLSAYGNGHGLKAGIGESEKFPLFPVDMVVTVIIESG